MGDSGRHRTPKTCPCGHVFGVPEGGEEGGRRRTLKTRPCRDVCGVQHERKGRECVEGNVSDTKNMPTRACSGCPTRGEWQGMRRTLKTCPQGHVCGVRHKGKGRWEGRGRVRHPRREEHNPRVVFVASGVVVGEGKGEGHPRREEHDPRVVFFVFGVVEGEGTPQTRRTRPWGRVLRVWVEEGEGKGGRG